MDLKLIQTNAEKFITEQGDYVFANWSSMTIDKLKDEGADVSTNFDKEIEEKFYDYVCKEYPDFGFQGEENPDLVKSGEYVWMIDPIDGTKQFAAGVPFWCITIALVNQQEEALIGLTYNAISKQLYTASKNGGAFLNGKQIQITSNTDISKLQVSVDLSTTRIDDSDFTEECHRKIDILERAFYRTRMMGNGALSLAWLAQGYFGAFVDPVRPQAKLIDIAGGLCIAKEAGAVIEKVEVEKNVYDTIVARREVAEQIKRLLQK